MRRITVVVLVFTVVLLIAYDVLALLKGGDRATISWVLWTNAHTFPIIPFSMGILCGHLFWGQDKP